MQDTVQYDLFFSVSQSFLGCKRLELRKSAPAEKSQERI